MNLHSTLCTILTVFLCLILSLNGQAQSSGEGPLGDLYLAKEGGLIQYSSEDPTGGNSDRRAIAPGETLVLMSHEGAGVIRRWWTTIAPRNSTEIHRNLIVRCFWDGEESPSVEVPVADFFGMGFGEWKDYISLPMNMTSGGYNTYWPMPFRERAIITVENMGDEPIQSFYYNIDVRTYEELPEEALYFHAQYRQVRTIQDQPVTLLEAEGRGHYVGTLLSMQPQRGNHLGYLEGDELIFVDGEKTPSIVGTGTEDYFSSGWYYITGEYSAPYHGVTIKDDKGRINTYRWHIEDPIPFTKSLRFDIEHGGINDTPGVEYSSVAFWYQTHPHAPFPPLPEERLPLAQTAAPNIEAESLIEEANITGGELRIQKMVNFDGQWSGDQLWWVNGQPGDQLTIPVKVEEEGIYELTGFFTRAGDYGIFRLKVNGKVVGNLVDGYNNDVEPTGPIFYGNLPFKKGVNEFTIELLGKDERAGGFGDGFLVGIDGFNISKK